MMDSYDLFSAMSGADEELVARSDYRVKSHRHEWIALLALAACFAIILISVFSFFRTPGPESLNTPPTTGVSVPDDTSSTVIAPNSPLQLNGSDVGTLNIVQLSHAEETSSMPDFLMYINQNDYHIAESAGTFYVYPVSGGTANQMTLSWQANNTPEQAAQQQASMLDSTMDSISAVEPDPLLGGITIRGSSGDKQAEVYIISDRQGGVFIFTLKFSTEDPDGHAIWFRDMMQTFEIKSADRDAPVWMTDLQTSVESFTGAFLENDFSGVDDLISDNAEIYTYEANVRADTRILQTHYEVDDDTAPTSASVSVRHKYWEDDAYDYITMELKYSDGKWQVEWAMIER